jgi:hypothetical protein
MDGRTDGEMNPMKPIGDSSDYVNETRSVTILLGRDLVDNAEVNVDPLSLCDCKGREGTALHGHTRYQGCANPFHGPYTKP